jgi:hypothetical protein
MNFSYILRSLILLAIVLTASKPRTGLASPHYPGEFVVSFAPRSVAQDSFSALADSFSANDLTVIKKLQGNVAVLSSAALSSSGSHAGVSSFASDLGINSDEICKRLLASRRVDSCTPNYRLSTTDHGGSDPLLSALWGMSDETGIAAVSAWGISTGSNQVVVAVIDTGVDYTHEDLAANIWSNPNEVAGNGIDDDGNGYIDDIRGVNLVLGAPNVNDPMDDNQHGTHVAGIIGAVHNNGVGLGGVNSAVKILPIKFMDASGAGRLSDAVAAIDYMVDLKVNRGINIKVANNSWGGGGYSSVLEGAIQRARDAGIVFVVAAGNEGIDVDLFPSYPGSYEVENVVTVAAIDADQNLASFSNYGGQGVDIAAPGVGINSTVPGQRYATLSGTSMATPHVVGSLALLFSIEPGLGVSNAVSRLLESGRDLSTLVSPDGMVPYVRSRRVVNAARLLRNERSPVSDPDAGLAPCGYSFHASNVIESNALDSAADLLTPVNQADEGDFKVLNLPFDFPFFRGATRTVYVSPNGVVYLYPPRNADYQVASRAPNNSIAAFHSDLTPRTAKQGIRAYVSSDRAVIYWSSEHYSLAGKGPISVRLTLHRSGLIRSTVSFESAKDPLELSWLVLGNGLTFPPAPPLGLIGASANSSANSSTLDIATAQRGLVKSASDRLDLSVTMVPNCFDISTSGPPEGELQLARVASIRIKVAPGGRKAAVKLSGAGSGKVPLRATIDGRWCSQISWGTMSNGKGSFQVSLPSSARKVSLYSPDSKGGVSMRRTSRSARRDKLEKMCAQFLQAVR